MKSLQKLKNGHWPVFLISLISAMTNLFLPVILVRLLSQEEIGIYKIFFLYVQSITFLSLTGAPLYSIYYWIGKKDQAKSYINQAWILSYSLSILSAVIAIIFLTQLAHLIALNTHQTLLLIFSAITSAPASFYGEYLIAKGRRIHGSMINSGFEILKAIIIITAVYITRSIDAALWAFTILFLIKLIIASNLGKKEGILNIEIQKEKLQEVWNYCFPISVAGALGFFLEKIDMILLSTRLTPENFAYYSMGCLVVPPLYILEMSVQKVLVPDLSNAYHHNQKSLMVNHYKKAQSDIGFLIIPAVFGLMIYNRPIIEILFTSEYMKSAEYLQIFAITYLAYIFPHDAIARATGQTKWILKMYSILTPLSILSVYLAAGKWGAKGALIAMIFFFFMPKVPGFIISSRTIGTPIRRLIAWRALGFYTAINIVLAFASYLLKPSFESERIWFLALGPLYAIVYLSIAITIKNYKEKNERPFTF